MGRLVLCVLVCVVGFWWLTLRYPGSLPGKSRLITSLSTLLGRRSKPLAIGRPMGVGVRKTGWGWGGQGGLAVRRRDKPGGTVRQIHLGWLGRGEGSAAKAGGARGSAVVARHDYRLARQRF